MKLSKSTGGSTPTDIYILGAPSDVQRQLFKAAKVQLQVEQLLRFQDASPGCGRVISFSHRPEFACDYAIVKSERQEAITDVLAWYLGGHDRRAHSMGDWLAEAFNGRVREVPNETEL